MSGRSWDLDEGGAVDDSVTVVPDLSGVRATASSDSLSVLVLSSSFIATYALPTMGEVTIGRAHSAEIYVDDPIVSRRHAVLTISPPSIRDLGSSNGTRVLGQKLAPGELRPLAIGDVILVGSSALLVQRGAQKVQPRRFWSREHFEDRLREECSRAERVNGAFSVVCLQADRHVPDVLLRRLLAHALRTSDVVGDWGGGYAILMVDADAEQARMVRERIDADLARNEISVRWGFAHFPDDGKRSEELLAKAQVAAPEARASTSPPSIEGRVVVDTAMRELFEIVDRVAVGDIGVLITGETGVGKEVMAEEIHRRSPRRDRAFLRLNCAALSESLLESELFGHERGAFTSAISAKPGLLETANGGTVLLDEIGEMPMSLQAKLLRVIEDKQVRRVGGLESKPLDVRFLAATNRDLQEHASRGLFRMDLYYRLAGMTIAIPPLRERPGDIAPLVREFLGQASRHLAGPVVTMTDEAFERLTTYPWPGNIRELKHVVERAVLLAGGAPIQVAHLALDKSTSRSRGSRQTQEASTVEDERQRILEVLAACGGNQSRAAKKLGMSRGALIRRLVTYGITRPQERD